MFAQIKEKWTSAFHENDFRRQFYVIIPLLIFILVVAANYLSFNEDRPGFPIGDPILALFEAVDVTWFTFILVYGGILLAFVHLLNYPRALLLALLSYIICISARMISMYMLPLEAPEGIIPLVDPTIYFFGGGRTYLKDLFFSGHVSTMTLLFPTAQASSLMLKEIP